MWLLWFDARTYKQIPFNKKSKGKVPINSILAQTNRDIYSSDYVRRKGVVIDIIVAVPLRVC